MDTKEAAVKEGGDRKSIEGITTLVINSGRIFPYTLQASDKEVRVKVEKSTVFDHSHSRWNVKYSVKCRHSWFPRRRYTCSG